MAAITVPDLENAKTDTDTIAAFANSSSPTTTTRLGEEVPTRAGLTADFNADKAALLEDLNSAAAITETGQNRIGAEAAAQAAAASASDAATAAQGALAGGKFYPSTAAAQADASLANGASYIVYTVGAAYWPVWKKDSPSASTDLQFAVPSAYAMQLSLKTVPAGTAYGEIDQYGWFGERLDFEGVRRFGALVAERSFNGVLRERVDEVLQATLRNARFRGPPALPFDINIYLQGGQSNSVGGVTPTAISTTAVPGIVMIDAIRSYTFSGPRYLNGLTAAVEVAEVVSTVQFGETGARKACEMVMNLVALENRSTFDEHGRMLLPLCVGHTSSTIPAMSPGGSGGDWTLATNNLQQIKSLAQAAGKSVGIIGVGWLWGAQGYDDALPAATWKSQVLGYKANIDTLWGLNIFGQRVGTIPFGIVQTTAHGAHGFPNNPYGAEAEAQLAEQDATIDIVNPEGPMFLETSSTHHSAREAAVIGGWIGMWLHRRCVLKETWKSFIPTVTRVDTTTIKVSYGALDPGFALSLKETGIPGTKRMQVGYGWMVYDQAAPTVALTMARQPRIEGSDVYLYMASALPALAGARFMPSTTYGNLVQVPKPQITEYATTLTVSGVAEPIERWMPIVDRAVP